MAAVAIPLRKATSCGRPQDSYTHPGRGLQCGASVRIDLTVQRNFFELRCRPLHGLYPLKNNNKRLHIIQFADDFIDENRKSGTIFILKDLAQGYFGDVPYLVGVPTLRQACAVTEHGFN